MGSDPDRTSREVLEHAPGAGLTHPRAAARSTATPVEAILLTIVMLAF